MIEVPRFRIVQVAVDWDGKWKPLPLLSYTPPAMADDDADTPVVIDTKPPEVTP